MLVGVAHIVDLHVVGTGEALRSAVICFYLSNEGVSVLENAGHLGLPIPEKPKAILAQLHDRMEEPEEAALRSRASKRPPGQGGRPDCPKTFSGGLEDRSPPSAIRIRRHARRIRALLCKASLRRLPPGSPEGARGNRRMIGKERRRRTFSTR